MKKPFPKSITPTPIVNTVIEVRFDTTFPSDAIFGILFSYLREEYPESSPLSAAHIPEPIRQQDDTLRFQPHNRLYNKIQKEYSVLIGPNVLSFVYKKIDDKNYPGWSGEIKNKVDFVLEKLFKSDIVSNVSRLSIRCIDFFETNIYDYTEFNIIENGKRTDQHHTNITQVKLMNNFNNKILISNNSGFQDSKGVRNGSIIDIDTISEIIPDDFIEQYSDYCEKAHQTNKDLFFGMIRKNFIDTLNPVYEEV